MTLIRLVIICIAKPFKKALIIITFIGVASMTVTCLLAGGDFPGSQLLLIGITANQTIEVVLKEVNVFLQLQVY